MSAREENWKALFQVSKDCLSAQEIGDFVFGRTDHVRSLKFKAHLQDCARCATEVALLREFESAEPRPGEQQAVTWIVERLKKNALETMAAESSKDVFPRNEKPVFRRKSGMGLRTLYLGSFAVAVACGLLALGLYFYPHRERPLPASNDSSAVLRSAQIEVYSPAGELEEVPRQFQWETLAGAAKYEITILEVDGAELWKAESVNTYITIPDEIRSKIVPAKQLLWKVAALDSSGQPIGTSETVRFRVRLR